MATQHERLYVVAYDIADPKRWRQVFKVMEAHGTWLQLSVFQCRLTARRRAQLGAKLDRIIQTGDDHVVIIDVGPADAVDPRVESLGKTYRTVERKVTVI